MLIQGRAVALEERRVLHLQLPTAAASAQAAQPLPARQAQQKLGLRPQQGLLEAAAMSALLLLLMLRVALLCLLQHPPDSDFPHPCYHLMPNSPPRWAAQPCPAPQTCLGAPQRAGPRLGAAGSRGRTGCQVPLEGCRCPLGQTPLLLGLPPCACSCLEGAVFAASVDEMRAGLPGGCDSGLSPCRSNSDTLMPDIVKQNCAHIRYPPAGRANSVTHLSCQSI